MLGAAVALLLCSASIPGVAGAIPASSSIRYPHQLAFVWYFGYLGDEFQPQTDLGLSQQQMITEAGTISSALGGRGNLVFVHAIAESSQKEITTGMLPEMRGYVSSLYQSANYVSGWLDLKFTNMTSPSNIYTQVNVMVNEIGVNAIWLDHAVDYYTYVTGPTFNQMMETLHQMFPNVLFFLNVTSHNGLIRPSPRTNWNSTTYVFPTAHLNGTDLTIEGDGGTGRQTLLLYNGLFADKVVVHFDSQASNPNEPMAEFANLTATQETGIIKQAFALGIHPSARDAGFNVLVPIVGANTYSLSHDQGTIYNGLNVGLNARGTAGDFLKVMQQYFP